MSEDLPNLDLFIKVIGMTGSAHDGEALAAMRRANALLTKWGWNWDKLLRSKVKIVEDPFNSIPTPQSRPAPPPPPPPPPRPTWTPRPQYQPPPRPTRARPKGRPMTIGEL